MRKSVRYSRMGQVSMVYSCVRSLIWYMATKSQDQCRYTSIPAARNKWNDPSLVGVMRGLFTAPAGLARRIARVAHATMTPALLSTRGEADLRHETPPDFHIRLHDLAPAFRRRRAGGSPAATDR